MNAGDMSLMNLIRDTGKRFVIPVYQRPYSWDEEQCAQLWEDVLAAGRRVIADPESDHTHFVGSVVWIQDGAMRAAGVTPALIIDGQQRITTLTLMLVALAEYARDHKDDDNLAFSYNRIIDGDYIVSEDYRKGDDHYRLTLSQGDRDVLRSIVDHLQHPQVETVGGPDHRLNANLEWFRERLANLDDPNAIWYGLRCLWMVSISLTQGQDNPQLIFESMNSTGKDLSTADLVRNYVLMGQHLDEQTDLYEHHWRKIEEALGTDSYDEIFDDFLRDWLSMLHAPSKLVSRDVYHVFKRYAEDTVHGDSERMKDLLDSIRRYAGYYARIAGGAEQDPELRKEFNDLVELKTTVANPLILTMYEAYHDGLFGHDDFVSMLRSLVSYVFRRMVCGLQSNSLNKFFLAFIKRLDDLRTQSVDGFDYREAFEAILLGETGRLRMPSDEEFHDELVNRDCYRFRCLYLLSSLENLQHPKDPINFSTGVYTIEHIMPQNALAHEQWRAMLCDPNTEQFNSHLSQLGNLTLTAYNSELKDGTFNQKKERAVGGYDKEHLTLSAELHDAVRWDFDAIARRGERLADDALKVWPKPSLSAQTITKYRAESDEAKRTKRSSKKVTLAMLCKAGLIHPGDELASQPAKYPAKAVITDKYTIRLDGSGPDDDTASSPSDAATRVLKRAGASTPSANGWTFWLFGDRSLADIRSEYLASNANNEDNGQTEDFRADFWEGFFDHCADREDFTEVYGDQSDRKRNPNNWASFGIGQIKLHPDALLNRRNGTVGAKLCFKDCADTYARLLARRGDVETMLAPLGGAVSWDDADADKRNRQVTVIRDADFAPESWDALYDWLAEALLMMRKVAALAQA